MMDTLQALFNNAQVLTVVMSGLAGFFGAVAPIVAARYQARQAAEQAKVVIARAAAEAEAKAAAAAEEAKESVRRNALDEWQNLYGERTKEVRHLTDTVVALQKQNGDQQSQLNVLKYKHEDCEARFVALEHRLGSVEKATKGGGA